MTNHSHETAPTQFVETQGIRYAYRRFGKPGTVPLLFLEYFNSNMDGWDPVVTNSLVYSDSSHGAQYQHAKMFVEHLKLFLGDGDSPAPALDPISTKFSVVLGN